MIKEKIKEIMKERNQILNKIQDDYWGDVKMCENKFIDILTENIDETIDYFLNYCTDEEFFWLSAMFDDIVERTQSKKLIEAFKDRLKKVDKSKYDQSKFENEFMREYINYDEYISEINNNISFAEKKYDENIKRE